MDEALRQAQSHVVTRAHLPVSVPYAAPRTPTQQRLAQIWQTVLSMDMVGVEDDYYDLGGDSFLAMIIFSMIGKSFSITLPPAILVEAPTIAKLAPRVDALILQAPSSPEHP